MMYLQRNVLTLYMYVFLIFISEASSLEDSSLVSTPKRSSTSQTVSTPAAVPIIESAEAIEAKAALKQVKATHLYHLGLGIREHCHLPIISLNI